MTSIAVTIILWAIVIVLFIVAYHMFKYSVKELNIKNIKDVMKYIFTKQS